MSTAKCEELEVYDFWKAIRRQRKEEKAAREKRAEQPAPPPVTFDRAGYPKSHAEVVAFRDFMLERIGAVGEYRTALLEAAREFDLTMAREQAATHYKSTKRRRLKPMTVDPALARRKIA